MVRHFTLEYWVDEEWYVGRLKEIPGVFSQGESLEELKENIGEVYHLMIEEEIPARITAQTKEIDIMDEEGGKINEKGGEDEEKDCGFFDCWNAGLSLWRCFNTSQG